MLVLWMERPRRQRAPSSPPTERREGMLRVVRTIINALVIVSASLANNFGGNAAAKEAAENRLMKNAEEIAAFVSGATPNLPKALVYRLLLTHGQQQVMAIDDIGKGAWSDEADMWNGMVKHIYTLTGTLAEGTAKEFPEMFQ